MFVVIEGVDGSGKSTVAKKLAAWLKSKNKKVVLTAEPTGSEIGKFIRKILSGDEKADARALALLFTADRAQHLADTIEPALAAGKVVISERYFHSTIAYQAAQGVSFEWLESLNEFARRPDVLIVLDVEPATGVGRTSTQEIFEEAEFLGRVRTNYRHFKGAKFVDAGRPLDDVLAECKKIVLDYVDSFS